MDLLGPKGHSPDGPVSPNPDPDREIRFFENPDFSFFRLFKLKDLTEYYPSELERAAEARRAVVASWLLKGGQKFALLMQIKHEFERAILITLDAQQDWVLSGPE